MTLPIRILELIFDFRVGGKGGGIGRFTIELCRNLDPKKFDRYLGALFDRGTSLEKNWLEQLNNENISAFCGSNWVEVHPYFSFWKATWSLWKWQSMYQADIIHSHSEFTDMAALILKFHPTKPTIIRSVHYGYQYEWRKRPLRRILLTNFLYPVLYELEIGISQAISENLNQRYVAKKLKKRSICIYNAIDTTRFQLDNLDQESKRNNLGIPKNSLIIGAVGRLTEQKGYSYLIEAAAILLQQIPQAYFLLVGDGELEGTLKGQAQDLGIFQRVKFTGSRTDIEEIFGCLDLFVSSSLWEGLPTVVMESMAAGVGIVATNIPGTRDLIQEGQTGWLTPPGDPASLAKKIQFALENPHLREKYAIQAKEKVQKFTIETVTAEHEKIYTSLLDEV